MFSVDGKVMETMNWITRFLYLQLLWVLFSLIGFVVGGLFPATFTLFGVSRKLMREHTDFPLFATYLEMFRQSFFKTNLLGYGMLLFSYSLYFYYTIFSQSPGMIGTVGAVVIAVMTFVFIAIALFVMPVYAHFDVGLIGVLKNAALTAISHPFHVIGMMLILVVFWLFFSFLPIIFIFCGVSLLVYILMMIANRAFINIELKLEAKQEVE